jgi:uncharacterized membrane protein YtjA (UPF0391 family)
VADAAAWRTSRAGLKTALGVHFLLAMTSGTVVAMLVQHLRSLAVGIDPGDGRFRTTASELPHMGSLLWLGMIFFAVAIVAFAVGAKELAGFTATAGQLMLLVFLVLGVVFLVAGLINKTA